MVSSLVLILSAIRNASKDNVRLTVLIASLLACSHWVKPLANTIPMLQEVNEQATELEETASFLSQKRESDF